MKLYTINRFFRLFRIVLVVSVTWNDEDKAHCTHLHFRWAKAFPLLD